MTAWLVLALFQDVSVLIGPYDYTDEVVLKEIDAAKTSIVLAYYHISLPSVRDRLLAARNRGVTVKVLLDARVHAKDSWDELAEQAGLQIRRIPNLRGAWGSMHKKFALIDGHTVIAGSGNLSSTGSQSNHENALLIRSPKIASLYAQEVAETEQIADYTASLLTPEELEAFVNNAQYPAWWDSKKDEILAKIRSMDKPTGWQPIGWLRTYFSPDDYCHKVILKELDKAQKEVFVAVFSLTRKDIAQKLAELAGKGIRVQVITDFNQASGDAMKEVNAVLAAAGIKHIRARNWNAWYAAMHHKYCVIDSKTVITGSYNWTYTASWSNDENMHVITSIPVAKRFVREFVSLMALYDPGFSASAYPWEAFHAPVTEVAFVCTMEGTKPGDTVCVAGSSPELGTWDPAKAVPLRTGSSTFPSWIGSIRIPSGTPLQFKFIVRRADGGVQWEAGPDILWTVPAEGHSLTYRWAFRNN